MRHALHAARYARGAALVAGGSGGIGQAISMALAAAGSDIALIYQNNEARAKQLAGEIEALNRKAMILQVDLRNAASVDAAAERVRSVLGAIHTSIYAAGPPIPFKYLSDVSVDEFHDAIQSDVIGCFNLIHSTLKDLRATKGALVALVTPAIHRYVKADVLSAAPKASIEALVRAIAAEEGRFGIRGNCVGPGVVTAGMYHRLIAEGYFDEKFLTTTREVVALRRLGTAEEVAGAVSFLASDLAGYITGQVLMVDGGYAI